MTRRPAPGSVLPGLDGALVIDKPRGLTSHDVVAAVRRTLAEPRAGHTGTLDPLATGVLPVLLGRATRLARFVAGGEKTYEAHVRFGWETDTDDESGTPVGNPTDVRVDAAVLEAALAAFRGPVLQQPPAFSAKRISGRRAYDIARAAETPPLQPAPVVAHELTVSAVNGAVATIRIVCSAGYYVRALARDLGRALGVGAHLAGLKRFASGPFRLEDAIPLDRVVQDPAAARAALRPPAAAVAGMPAVALGDDALRRVRQGAEVPLPDEAAAAIGGRLLRVMDSGGNLVAIAEPGTRPGLLHPVVVLV